MVLCSMTSPGSVVQVGRVGFELSRFEVVGDSCQVEGRWFGVRGRRFMRPALTLVVAGQPIRLLADLADKPWPAQDGETWRARFPYTIDRAQSPEAELTVAPDVTITLPAPALHGATADTAASPGTDAAREPGLGAAGGRSQLNAHGALRSPDRPHHRSETSAIGDERREVDALISELVDARDTARRLRQQLDRMDADKTRAAELLDDVSRQLQELVREREESQTARDRIAAELEAVQRERDEIVAERDTALRERSRIEVAREAAQRGHDQALQASEAADVARDRALSERGAALTAQRQAASDRDAALAAKDQAVAERDAALSLRDHALAERDAAVAARDEAVSAREALSGTNARLQSDLADLRSARGAALVMRRAAQEPAVSRRYTTVIPVAVAIVVVLGIVLILVFLVHVV